MINSQRVARPGGFAHAMLKELQAEFSEIFNEIACLFQKTYDSKFWLTIVCVCVFMTVSTAQNIYPGSLLSSPYPSSVS